MSALSPIGYLTFIGEILFSLLIAGLILVNVLVWFPLLSYSYHWWFG